jgi:hypothetical protein
MPRDSLIGFGSIIAVAIQIVGCAGGDDAPSAVPQVQFEHGRASIGPGADLTIGSTGPSVRALHAYLTRFGYFPNDELAREYPAWRPVADAPKNLDVYDDNSARAVRFLQHNVGLSSTGIVDQSTLAFLNESRCGLPDNIPDLSQDDKYAIAGNSWLPTRNLTWRLTNTTASLTQAQARAAIAAAFAGWQAETELTFSELLSGTANIMISFGAIDGPGGVLGQSQFPSGGGSILLDTAETWSVATPTPAVANDLQSVVLHESGHALGLMHSSLCGAAVMCPGISKGTQSRSLFDDDYVAISAIYDALVMLPGAASDVGAGADGSLWVIGTTPVPGGGFTIHKWNGTTWDQSNGGAVRIAVSPAGIPWVINSSGNIYVRTTSSATTGTWNQVFGQAKDIGIGFDGSVWIVANVLGDGEVMKWNGASWDGTNGFATNVAVSPLGVPWVINSAGDVYRRNTSSPVGGTWELLPPISNVLPQDIGFGDGNYPWVTDTKSIGYFWMNFNFVWNEQFSFRDAPAKKEWHLTNSSGLPQAQSGPTEIAVGPHGKPYVVLPDGTILTVTK